MLQDFRGDTDICLIIGGSSPQTNDISAILLDNILRNDNIAHGFGHLAAFAVNNIAVSQNGFIGSLAGYSNGGQEGGLEPTAMLVAALQVHINRPAQLRTLSCYCHMGGAAIEPNVHDIGFLVEMVVTAFRAHSASGQQLFSAMSPPCIGAFLFKPVSNSIDGSFVNQMLAAFVAIEYGNGHAPNTLTADAPVMAVANHVVDALLAPGGNPFYIVSNSLQGVITEAINGCEPLGGCTEDDGVLAAPAVCVLVLNVFLAQQAVQLGQVFQNGDIGIEYEHALELLASFSSELALGINRAQDGQLVFQAGLKVDITMTRSGMYAASTSFQGYIVSQNNNTLAMVIFWEGMLAFSKLHSTAHGGAQNIAQILVAFFANLFQQILSHKEHFTLALNPSVFQIGVQGHSHVSRHGPRGGGPNYHVSLFAFSSFRSLAIILNQGHLYENSRSLLLAVFNFSLCQSSFAMRAPVYGLFTLVDIALISHSAEHTNLLSLKAVVQCYIGVIPIAQHTQTLEVLTLDINPVQREIMAFAAQSQNIQLFTVQAQLLNAGVLDGHAVGIPAGYIRCIKALGIFIFYNDILQNFVQSSTHVNLAVGIGRAIVQHKFGMSCMQCLLLVINIVFLPELQKIRLALGQTSAHRKLCFRQIQCFAVIH